MFPVVFIALAAIAVDTARWYVEVQRVQNAADAGALAGVPYMPQDLVNARSTALTVTARNGFTDGAGGVVVQAEQGNRPSELKVTVTSTVQNAFGRLIGTPSTTISRSATSDYTGPAPMGSPCNTFGNEPLSGSGGAKDVSGGTGSALPSVAPFPNCSSTPDFWATIEGPGTGKVQGDRYQTKGCGNAGVDECTGLTNDEYNEQGYFWTVKVAAGAVGTPVDLQLYDPEFAHTPPAGFSGTTYQCGTLPEPAVLDDDMNDYVGTDGKTRYTSGYYTAAASAFCPGDGNPGYGSGPSSSNVMTTSFVLREQTDTMNPMKAAVQKDTSGSACIKQYRGVGSVPTYGDLKKGDAAYDDHLAQTFHNWVSFCTFTPTRTGDYYIQVRSNVSAGGSSLTNTNGKGSIIYSGNTAAAEPTGNTTTGTGANSFAMRAVTLSGKEKAVSVSGYDRMPIFANTDDAETTFNLIRVLPGAAGQYVSFSFFDVADVTGSGTGSVQVLPPSDATGTITSVPFPGSCKASGGYAGAGQVLSGCSATVSNAKNNGAVETMSIPIPTDYSCDYASAGGCWYRVKVSFPGNKVNDTTTWDASIVGDPIRLVE